MRDGNGLLIAFGYLVATEGKAGRVEMLEALLNAFPGTDSQSQLAKQQITPIGMDFIERPAKLKAIEHLCADPGSKQQIEWFVGKKLRGE